MRDLFSRVVLIQQKWYFHTSFWIIMNYSLYNHCGVPNAQCGSSEMADSDYLLQPKGSFCTSHSQVIIWFKSLNLNFFFFCSETHRLQNHIQYRDIGWWLYPAVAHFHSLQNCLGVSNSIPRAHRFTTRALGSTISWSSTGTGTRHFLEAWFLPRERIQLFDPTFSC